MAQVSNLAIKFQTGSDNTVYSTWDFKESTSAGGGGGGGAVTAGAKVTVKQGSTWYNGVGIASFVFSYQWIVLEVRGDRAVINRSTDGAYAIMSPIHVNNLNVVGGSSSSGTTSGVAPNTTDHYKVEWFYSTGDGVWFTGSSSDVKVKNATYTPPGNAVKVKCTVTPVSKTYQSNGKETSYWTGTAVSKEYLLEENPPDKPAAPSVVIDKYKLTAKLDNIQDAKAEEIEFEVVSGTSKFATGNATVMTARAEYSCVITAGGYYRVRCRAINFVGTSRVYSEWSPYSSEVTTVPATPVNVRCLVLTKSSVKISWSVDETADSYKVEYTTNKDYFDSSSEVKSITVQAAYANITGIDSGHEWYFRVQATNEKGSSGWSDIVYGVIGTKPEAPTTWTLTTTAKIGEEVVLYWVHNTADGSVQNEAQIELTINGEASIVTVDTSDDEPNEDESDKIYSHKLDLSPYPEGVEVLWRVRTRGITYEYSDWSVQRTVNVYAPPVSTLTLGDGSGILSAFPYNIGVKVGPDTQHAISYHISITTVYSYQTIDQVGETVMVNAGQEIFSKVINSSDNELVYQLTPDNVVFENNQPYKTTITVSMNSGLLAVSEGYFTVSWDDESYFPEASVTIDKETLCAYIMPYCVDEDNNLIGDVTLSVYRREFDGSFTEIATDINNSGYSSVTDPHPALDYARYRIVARNISTNVMSFSDLPGQPVNNPSIVIQWDEAWSRFDYNQESAPETPPWVGSMIKIPYNISVSENYDKDSSLVGYIGRSRPVSYYGTQKNLTENWNVEIPRDDKETLYALRRLADWMGDVYVREPSGKGYNANVSVSLNIRSQSVTIPVSFKVSRVEGDK